MQWSWCSIKQAQSCSSVQLQAAQPIKKWNCTRVMQFCFSLFTASRPPTLSSKDVFFSPEDTALFSYIDCWITSAFIHRNTSAAAGGLVIFDLSCSSVIDMKAYQKLAVKKLSRPFQSIIHAKRTYRELRLLKHMKHENVSCLRARNCVGLHFFSPVKLLSKLCSLSCRNAHACSGDLHSELKLVETGSVVAALLGSLLQLSQLGNHVT